MDKRKLIAGTASKSKYPKWEVSKITGVLLENIFEALQQGEEVCINGFGKFELTVSKPYTRLHPKTKKPIHTPEKVRITFTASKKFKPVDDVLEKIKAQKEASL